MHRRGVEYRMELRFRHAASAELESFVDRYRDAFRTLYSDTGLWNEDLIIAGYEQNTEQLYFTIRHTIAAHLTKRPVFGRKRAAEGWFEVHLSIESRHIVVLYSEDKKTSTRWVESISIGRKPIIF